MFTLRKILLSNSIPAHCPDFERFKFVLILTCPIVKLHYGKLLFAEFSFF